MKIKHWSSAVSAIIGVTLAISGCGYNEAQMGATPTTANATSSNSKQEPTSVRSQTAKIGQGVQVGKFTVKVNKVSYQDKIDDGGFHMAPSANGGKWLIVNVTITNNDSTARTLDTSMFRLLHGQTKYNASGEADPWINNNDGLMFKELNPGLKLTANVAFNVPSQTTYQLQVDSGVLFANTGSVIIDLK